MPDAPAVLGKAIWIWEGFLQLNSQRQWGQHGPQAVSITHIESWMNVYDVDRYDKPFVSDLFLTLDRKYVEHQYDLLKKERDKQNKKSRGGRGR